MTGFVEDPPRIGACYSQAKSIALAMLDLPLGQRAGALAIACRGDAELALEVQWLLDAAQDASHDAEPGPPLIDPLESVDVWLEARLPRDYHVLRRIGEGGMGVVYLAERRDDQLHQRVALKLLHPLPDADPITHRRFASERRILSTLDHPNIARLIDGGVSAGGRPFLTMEYVDGERIDHYCDAHALGWRQRVALVIKVCEAVGHAHRRLVIHRDIKPSNILVRADGEPKLLDFGLARLLDDSHTEHTRSELRALTLAHASPEQIEGGVLGTASDVYSLGVLLYQLVTGVRPFDHAGATYSLTRAILAGDVIPPSRAVRHTATTRSGRIRHRVPPDLDAIVLMAMRREPERRYASAHELSSDLRRLLAERPVHAQRGRRWYRLRRFAARRRWMLAAGVAATALLTGMVLDRLHQQSRIAAERDRAGAVVTFMDELFHHADSLHVRGQDMTVRQMLGVGADGLRGRTDLSPEHHAALLLATGRAYNALGLAKDAVPLLELARDALEQTQADAGQRAALQLSLAAAYSASRRIGDAMAADEAALQLLRAQPGKHADDIAAATIRLLHNHAVNLDRPLARVRAELRSVLDDLDARPAAPDALRIAAWRAMVMAHGADNDGALDAAGNAMRIATRLYRADDPRLLATRNAYVTALQERDPQRAAELLPDLIADYERRAGTSVRVAELLANLGGTLVRIGRTHDSLPVFRRATAVARAASGEHSPLYRQIISNNAAAHLALGDGEHAEALVRIVLPGLIADARIAGAAEAQVFLASASETLAQAALLRRDARLAERELRRAADALARIELDAYPELAARVLVQLAQVQRDRGRARSVVRTLDRLDATIVGRADAQFAPYRETARALRASLAQTSSGRG